MSAPKRNPDQRTAMMVVCAQLGERPAFDALIDLWHMPLWRYVRSMLADDAAAEEVVQEAWLRVIRSLPKLRDPQRFAPWFFTLARRSVIDHLRRKQNRIELVDARDPDDVAVPPPDPGDQELIGLLRQGVGLLPGPEREATTLYYFAHLSLDEIAELTDVPSGTVKSRLYRARRRLSDYLSQQGDPV